MFLEKIRINNYKKLKNFKVKFEEEDIKDIDDRQMNVSVIIGENGTAKTTLFELIVDIFTGETSDKKGYSFAVDYLIDKENYVFEFNGTIPKQLPTKLIISSYTPVDKLKKYFKNNNNLVKVTGNIMNRSIVKDTSDSILMGALKQDNDTIVELIEYIGYEFGGCLIEISNGIKNSMRNQMLEKKISTINEEDLYKLNEFLEKSIIHHINELDYSLNKINHVLDKDKLCQSIINYYELCTKNKSAMYNMKSYNEEFVESLYLNLSFIQAKLDLLTKEYSLLIPNIKKGKKKRVVSSNNLDKYLGGKEQLINDLFFLKILEINLCDDIWFESENEPIPLSLWSSGELSLFVRMMELYENACDNSIILIDEPETHLHPKWICGYVSILKKILGKTKCHVLIATHSPLIVGDIQSKAIVALKKQNFKIEQYRVSEETLGLNYEVILNEVFGIESLKNRMLDEYAQKVRELLVDKSYDEANELYKKLADSQEKYELFLELKKYSK